MMCSKNRILAAIKNKSGASLLFVLGIMLLLLAVSGSLLAAASANYGSNVRQNQYNAAVVLNDSIQRNIRHSLQIPSTELSDFNASLASNLARAIYDASVENDELTMFELNLGDIIPDDTYVTLKFPMQTVHITPAVPEMPELGIERVPRTAFLNARMIVEVIVTVGTGNNARVLTTQATYEYSGVMTDDGDWNDEAEPSVGTMSFEKTNPNDYADPGRWVMVSYEISE